MTDWHANLPFFSPLLFSTSTRIGLGIFNRKTTRKIRLFSNYLTSIFFFVFVNGNVSLFFFLNKKKKNLVIFLCISPRMPKNNS